MIARPLALETDDYFVYQYNLNEVTNSTSTVFLLLVRKDDFKTISVSNSEFILSLNLNQNNVGAAVEKILLCEIFK